MVHLEQMNKRLDMLEKTCMSLIEKNNNTPSVCPYHAQQMTAQQHLEKRIQRDIEQEVTEDQQLAKSTSTQQQPRASLRRRAAV